MYSYWFIYSTPKETHAHDVLLAKKIVIIIGECETIQFLQKQKLCDKLHNYFISLKLCKSNSVKFSVQSLAVDSKSLRLWWWPHLDDLRGGLRIDRYRSSLDDDGLVVVALELHFDGRQLGLCQLNLQKKTAVNN